MVRGAVLALVVLIVAGCSGGQSGSVTLASTAASPTPSAVATVATGAWYTSSAANAKYYYCDADRVEIAAKNRRAYPSEQALLAEWSGKRTKWPRSKC